jgi:hypothetical protein
MKRLNVSVGSVAPFASAHDPAVAAAACRVMAASMNAISIDQLLQNFRVGASLRACSCRFVLF